MKRCLFPLLLSLLLASPACAERTMEASVQLTVGYSPRKATKSEAITLKTPKLAELMGMSAGNVLCVADASDHAKPWTFKHRSTAQVETDLSDKLSMEVLGYSEVGAFKEPAPMAPKKNVTLGRVTSTRTVKIKFSPAADFVCDFWGALVVNYVVTQEAGRPDASWLPLAASMKMAGIWGTSAEGERGAASLTMASGPLKHAISGDAATSLAGDAAASLPGSYSGTIATDCAGVGYSGKLDVRIGADSNVTPGWTNLGKLKGGKIETDGKVTGMSITIESASKGTVVIPYTGRVSGNSLSLTGQVDGFVSTITAQKQ
jgi:hypothetical protein